MYTIYLCCFLLRVNTTGNTKYPRYLRAAIKEQRLQVFALLAHNFMLMVNRIQKPVPTTAGGGGRRDISNYWGMGHDCIAYTCIYKVKESRKRSGVVQRVPGGLGYQIYMTFGT